MKELLFFVFGMVFGCGTGYMLSHTLKVSKIRYILLGGIIGGLVGFFVVSQF